MSGAEGEAYGKKMRREEEEEEVAAESGGRADAERKAKLKERKVSWSKLKRVDSLNLEAGRVSMVAQNSYEMGWRTTLCLAFQSIGVVYGDIGTSPLYVFSSIFTNGIIKHEDDILGVLSLIIYTITLLPFLKYVFIVLWANDNGNGGAFALYSLICRHMKMSLIPNEQPEDRELSNYRLETPSSQVKWVHKLKQKLEGSLVSRVGLLFLAIVGTSMVIGDGILTPSISVLSAVSGISKSLGQASQAMISGAFSIISRALSLGCFPRVKVVHTSVKHKGRVYIPEMNYMFMFACILVCAAFKTTDKISHAYVIGDMMITTTLVSLIMLVIWKKSLRRVALFFFGFGFIEIVYFSSQLTKFTRGGYLPIVLAFFLTMVMGIRHYVHKERYMFELKNKISNAYLNEVANNPNVRRVPRIGLMYSELVQGIPPIFSHLIGSIPSIHSIVVFVSIKAIPVSNVASEERFLFRQVEPREYRVFRCVVRHGYNDVLGDPVEFESQLIQIRRHTFKNKTTLQRRWSITLIQLHSVFGRECRQFTHPWSRRGTQIHRRALEKGVVYMLGEAKVVAHPNSSIFNKIVVNYVYSFFRKNFRQGRIPWQSHVKDFSRRE
ncbi:hypothetical protein ACSQ67_019923 [Phaseolus vulgaris]